MQMLIHNSGGRSPFRANGSFEGEISPEDLFNMFFGGGFPGGGGVQFGGSPFGAPSAYDFKLRSQKSCFLFHAIDVVYRARC